MKRVDFSIGYSFVALILVFFGAGFIFGSNTVGKALSGIVISILSSYIFFFLTVTLKERSDKEKINKIVTPMLSDIATSFFISIHNSVLYPLHLQSKHRASQLSENELNDLMDESILNTPIKSFRTIHPYEPALNGVSPETYIEQLVQDTTIPILSIIDKIKPYYFMLDYETIKTLTRLENSSYMRLSGMMIKHEKKFEFHKPFFIECYRHIREIAQTTEIEHSQYI